MYIYNITIKVATEIHDSWLEWMHEVHIPAILKTGKFTNHQLLRLREVDESDGPTYALQLFAESKADYNAFKVVHEATFSKQQKASWGEKMLSFSTLMEIVH
ncbi:hypothetical protein GCM10027566_15570 [Arachidicoccus ginsenosidivorans]|jgi:hypothetical protein|uniref:DUF4286 family protein n=1 Tax=Arachidicoccus ginsenosidivorans TaxID=496057 RepID=A0A5B8VHA8_9BACT|nr:DUF4286 family protein [Arachidicoccus ginsenosidivorans]QEC70967.1 DUF4286 family protein [Arachidicoccus ginsenosidivorans]